MPRPFQSDSERDQRAPAGSAIPQCDGFEIAARSEIHFLPASCVLRQGMRWIQVDAVGLAEIVRRFAALKINPEFPGICLDFEHQLGPAAGWIDSIEQRPGGLFASVAWTKPGVDAVVSGSYRRVSPGFTDCDAVFGSERIAGACPSDELCWRPVELDHLSLVNAPLFTMLPAIVPPMIAPKEEPTSNGALADFLDSVPAHVAGQITISFSRPSQ